MKTAFKLLKSFGLLSVFIVSILLSSGLTQAIAPVNVRTNTPMVRDGEVWDVELFGDNVIVAGEFTTVRRQNSSTDLAIPNIFAYNINTGKLVEDFLPVVDGEIRDIEVTDDRFYISGKFNTVDGQNRRKIAAFDRQLNLLDWRVEGIDASVPTIAANNTWLYFGGQFESVDADSSLKYISRARIDTGAVDHSFKFTWGTAIGKDYDGPNGTRIFTKGVARVALTPDNRLFVSHRHDAVNGQNLPGLFQYNNGLVNGWTARLDDNTPVYSTQHRCNGDKIVQPRDLEISPDGSFLVLVHQGGDNGLTCDTTIKVTTGASGRIDWISRAFDSIFSVAIGTDAIYIGGHFRYLVTDAAPTAFPHPEIERYGADPERDGRFKRDFTDPGWAVKTEQIGALSIDRGRAIESWAPGSNTQIGVLGMTVIDRGLLIGQHNNEGTWDVVAGHTTGRAAFFDRGGFTQPFPPEPEFCSTTLLANGGIRLTWRTNANARPLSIWKNGNWIRQVDALTNYTDLEATHEDEFSIRSIQGGAKEFNVCPISNPDQIPEPIVFSCSATYLGLNNGVRYDWNDSDLSYFGVLTSSVWQNTLPRGSQSYIDADAIGLETYQLRVPQDGVKTLFDCGLTNPEDLPAQGDIIDCKITTNAANGTASLSWNNLNHRFYSVRKNTQWRWTGATTSFVDNQYQAGDQYSVRIKLDGVKTDFNCNAN